MEALVYCTAGRSSACAEPTCICDLVLSEASIVSLIGLGIYHLCWPNTTKKRQNTYDGYTGLAQTVAQPSWVRELSPLSEQVEAAGLLIDLLFGAALLIYGESQSCPFNFVAATFPIYAILLLAARKYYNGAGTRSHALVLYAVQSLLAAYVAPAAFIRPTSSLYRTAVVSRLFIFVGLSVLHFMAPLVPSKASRYGISTLQKPAQDEGANLFSQLSFAWINSLVWKAFRKPLRVLDLYDMRQSELTAYVSQDFRLTVAVTLPLLRRVFQYLRNDIFSQAAWAVAMSFSVLAFPALMRVILQHLERPDATRIETAWLGVGGLLISGVLATTAECQCNWIGRKIGGKLRSILVSEIYAKVLRKSSSKTLQTIEGKEKSSDSDPSSSDGEGNVLNLISVDVEVISEMSTSLYLAGVNFPLQITLGTYLLYRIMGISGVIAVAMMMGLLPFNIWLSKKVMQVQGLVLAASDARLQASNELLSNIRTVKFCTYEEVLEEKILQRRGFELGRMRLQFIWWSLSMVLFYSLPFILTIFTFFLYTIVWKNSLETSIAFPALAMFAILRIPLNRLADSITFLMQAYVSIQRISRFLGKHDIAKSTQLSNDGSRSIGFGNATIIWPTSRMSSEQQGDDIPLTEVNSSQTFKLQDLNLMFRSEGLNLICGASGSGKSALLLALLGEMEILGGIVSFPYVDTVFEQPSSTDGLLDTTAYCSQDPWLMNRSIRQNIIMNLDFDGNRYESVLEAVALVQDLATLDHGDQELAGENGSRLSGGQKQRVALARALYSKSRYMLLDDCLSALDARTAHHIFFKGLKGSLMQKRTCIFATHHIQLAAPHADYIAILDAGRIVAHGEASELISAGWLRGDLNDSEIDSPISEASSSSSILDLTTKEKADEANMMDNIYLDPNSDLEGQEVKQQYEEKMSEGSVSWSVVYTYIRAMGPFWYWLIVPALFAVQQVAAVGTTFWVKEWASNYDAYSPTLYPDATLPLDAAESLRDIPAGYYLLVYTFIGVAYALITFIRDLTVFHGSLKASSELYKCMLSAILHAKLVFFDRVPLGQITNRFSRDVEVMDQSITTFAISTFQIVTSLVVVIGSISIFIPAFLIVALFISVAYCLVATVYISSARDLKRIENIQRSPLYQQFTETFAGVVSIRAYAQTVAFVEETYGLVDKLNQAWVLQGAGKEWLSFYVGVLSAFISFSTGVFILWNIDSIDLGSAGLVLTYAGVFTESVMWLVQVYAIINQNFNSVERIIEFTQAEQEAVNPPVPAREVIPHNWPSEGVISCKDYTTRYAPELKPALNSITFGTSGGERVAIVGRTGAGKSTMGLALIRGVEASRGCIEIDGVNIASVSLHKLRRAVTIVPQDPKLFDGTVRYNLSPVNDQSDEQMLEALRAVRLLTDKEPGSSTYAMLDTPADVLSRGQRQLLCIARGLLRRSRVLILDEATASVDHSTDAAIQDAVRAVAATGTTVLTVAHRLPTIADYDRVIVLDAGKVVEVGTCAELLSNNGDGALFRNLCEQSGDYEEIARAASKTARS